MINGHTNAQNCRRHKLPSPLAKKIQNGQMNPKNCFRLKSARSLPTFGKESYFGDFNYSHRRESEKARLLNPIKICCFLLMKTF